MKQLKRFFSAFLVFCLIISMFAVTAHAATSGKCGENLRWDLSTQGVLNITGTGSMDDYGTIAPPWSGEYIRMVAINTGVTTIGEAAFEGCADLTTVMIYGSLTEIGNDAFANCVKLGNVTIPSSVTTIGAHAFMSCNNMTSVTVPGSVRVLGEGAFYGCAKLASVTVGSGATAIGDGAFQNCDQLTTVTIPNSVTTIGESAFSDCDGLAAITIPGSVTTIGDGAFSDCDSLSCITIPDSVAAIGESAFARCAQLNEIEFSGKAPNIAFDAFTDVTATVRYPAKDSSWNGNMYGYGGDLTWLHSGDHEYTAVRQDSTCTSYGKIDYTCFCGHSYTEFLDPLPHDFSTVVTAPTCTTEGYTTYTCRTCGYTYNDYFTGIIDHSFGAWTVTIAATCTQDGMESRTCDCGATETKTIQATGHIWSEWSVTRAETCTAAGETTRRCQKCGVVQTAVIEPLDHHYSQWEMIRDVTCTEDGEERRTCTRSGCGHQEINAITATGHSLGSWELIQSPTCTAAGVEIRSCGNCDYQISRTVEANGHVLYTEIVPATCVTEGYTIYRCDNCTFSYVHDVVPAGNHDRVMEEWNCVEPGCETPGSYELVERCFVCNTIFSREYMERPATGHNYVNGICTSCGDINIILETPNVKAANIISSGKIKLTWQAVEGAHKYAIYRAVSENGPYALLSTTASVSYTDSKAKTGVKYYYYVVATSENDIVSAASNIVSCTCDLAQPKVTVSNVASTGKIKLSWDKVEGAKQYKVYWATSKNGEYKLLKTLTGNTITHSSVSAGTTGYYKVVAVHTNSNANSAFSSVKSCTCDLAQPKVTLANVKSSGKIKISWEKIAGAVKYEVYRATSQNGKYTLLKTVTGTSLTNTSVEAGKTYYYKVVAIYTKSAANSAESAVKSRTCDLAQPVASVSRNSSGKPVVSWKAVSGASKYTVYIYNSKGTLVKTSATTKTKLIHSSATKNATYTYQVVAVHANSSANSAKSTGVSIKSK